MLAMLLTAPGLPLSPADLPVPAPGPDQVLLKVLACGVCRTDLHVVDGELAEPVLPLIPGHQIVGRVEEVGGAVTRFRVGDRVGVPWLGWTCGERVIRSVANLTRRDGEEFLALAPRVPIRTEARAYPLLEANEALDDLRRGRVRGAAVVQPLQFPR